MGKKCYSMSRLVGFCTRCILAFFGLVYLLTQCPMKTMMFAFVLWPFSGFGVTAGAHRLWTHHSYRASCCMQWMLVFMYSVADQGQLIGWVITHKLHHRYSDTHNDPHNRRRGFWYAHIGCVFDPENTKKCNELLTSDDISEIASHITKAVCVHDKYSIWFDPLCSLVLPTIIAWSWNDPIGGLLVAGALRWFVVLNFTFMVNSLAHGIKDDKSIPVSNSLVSILALGEGWHDFHHKFPHDYRAAEFGAWKQFNPTSMFIEMCCRLGLCDNLGSRSTDRMSQHH